MPQRPFLQKINYSIFYKDDYFTGKGGKGQGDGAQDQPQPGPSAQPQQQHQPGPAGDATAAQGGPKKQNPKGPQRQGSKDQSPGPGLPVQGPPPGMGRQASPAQGPPPGVGRPQGFAGPQPAQHGQRPQWGPSPGAAVPFPKQQQQFRYFMFVWRNNIFNKLSRYVVFMGLGGQMTTLFSNFCPFGSC